MKKWYKSPLIISLIVISVGWFSYITRSAILSEGKANAADVKIIEKVIEERKEQNTERWEKVCSDIEGLKKDMKSQTDKIYALLLEMSSHDKKIKR